MKMFHLYKQELITLLKILGLKVGPARINNYHSNTRQNIFICDIKTCIVKEIRCILDELTDLNE